MNINPRSGEIDHHLDVVINGSVCTRELSPRSFRFRIARAPSTRCIGPTRARCLRKPRDTSQVRALLAS